jgi:hypothetical protein
LFGEIIAVFVRKRLLNVEARGTNSYHSSLKVFKNSVLKGMFGAKREEVTGMWRK